MISGLSFYKTCSVCPEQYDVYKDGCIVGYVRLRWGELTCEYPDVFGDLIYSASIGDSFSGTFESEDQRQTHLRNIANKIIERIEGWFYVQKYSFMF